MDLLTNLPYGPIRGGGAGGEPLIPLSHWRADSFTGTAGSYVLTDLSGNDRPLTQSAGNVTPATGINSRAKLACSTAANFQGSSTYSSRYNKTVITVFQRTGTSRIGLFGAAGASPFNWFWQGFDGTDIRNQYAGNGSSDSGSAQAADANDADSVRVYLDYSARSVMVSGRDNRFLPVVTTTVHDGDGGAFSPALGTSYRGMIGDWYETRVYNSILTTSQLDAIATELNDYYGLTQPLWSDLTTRNLILIGGQSNAYGPIAIASLPAGYSGSQGGVNIWTGTAYGATIATLDSTENNNQGAGGSKQNTFGFEMSIGKDYVDRLGGSVNLYKYAAGSTSLSTLTASNWAPQVTSSLNRGFIREYWLNFYAMQQLGLRPNPIAFAWFQGEQDATDLSSANAYESNLTNFINSMTPQTASSPTWLLMRIADDGDGAYKDTVRAAQASVASAMSNVTLIDTDGYAMADAVHLSAAGHIALGSYLAGLLP